MRSYTFKTADEAWAEINKKFINQDEELFCENQGASITNSLFTYGLSFVVENAEFDPEFDFGKIFGYTISKWSTLLNNYVDLDALDKLKLQVRELEKNKTVNRNYHIGFSFADANSNGKGCLLSGIFSRMLYIEKPRLTVILRASEVVTRLPWDLLLAVRLGEYVFGHTDFSVEFVIRSAFADDYSVMLFNGYEKIEPLIDAVENESRRKRLHKVLRKVRKAADKGVDPKYQAYTRVFKIFNPSKYGKDEMKSFKAKDCVIGNWDGIPLPESCPSILVRNRIKNAYLKFIERYDLKMFQDFDKNKKVVKFGKKNEEEPESVFKEEEDDFNFDENVQEDSNE